MSVDKNGKKSTVIRFVDETGQQMIVRRFSSFLFSMNSNFLAYGIRFSQSSSVVQTSRIKQRFCFCSKNEKEKQNKSDRKSFLPFFVFVFRCLTRRKFDFYRSKPRPRRSKCKKQMKRRKMTCLTRPWRVNERKKTLSRSIDRILNT